MLDIFKANEIFDRYNSDDNRFVKIYIQHYGHILQTRYKLLLAGDFGLHHSTVLRFTILIIE